MTDEKLKKTVREGIDDALTKYGLDTSDPTAMQADMVYLRKSRIGSDEFIKWTKRSGLTAAISCVVVALWQGIKQLIHGG